MNHWLSKHINELPLSNIVIGLDETGTPVIQDITPGTRTRICNEFTQADIWFILTEMVKPHRLIPLSYDCLTDYWIYYIKEGGC